MRFPAVLLNAAFVAASTLTVATGVFLGTPGEAAAQFAAPAPGGGGMRGGGDFEVYDPCAYNDCYRRPRRPPPPPRHLRPLYPPPPGAMILPEPYYEEEYIEPAPRRRPARKTETAKKPKQSPKRDSGLPDARGQTAGRDFAPDEVLIEFPLSTPQSEIDAIAQQQGIERLGSQEITLLNTRLHRWRVPAGRSAQAVAQALRNDSRVTAANLNRIYTLQETAPAGPQQYAAEKLGLREAHSITSGGSTLVALIDSGADADHPELAGSITETYDAVGGDFVAHTHGTGMAGAIVAHQQVMGSAPGARLLNVRAFAPNGRTSDGTSFDIVKGMDWAAQKGARVFNLSFAGPRDPLMARVVKAAIDKNIVIIAAAGNQGPKSPPLYPAAESGVIAVTAVDAEDGVLKVANRGTYVTLAAPGVDILLPAPDKAYSVTSGTSIATAYISGIAALMIAQNPEADQKEIYAVLVGTARDLGAKGRDREFGAGLANPVAALEAMAPVPLAVAAPAGDGLPVR